MTSNQRIYPEVVENTLDVLLESITDMEFKIPMDFNALRDVLGTVLFEHWLTGSDEIPFDEDGLSKLLNRASAITLVQQMEQEGLMDSIEDGMGNDIVFLTQKGKEADNFLTKLINNGK